MQAQVSVDHASLNLSISCVNRISVGAHNPTKIPNRSAWALSSEVTPLFMYQIEIDPTTDTRLKTNVIIDSVFIF